MEGFYRMNIKDPGYDIGYKNSDCFWGTHPAELVKNVATLFADISKINILDLGCGEGKNSYYLATKGFNVTGIDASIIAIEKARKLWDKIENLSFYIGDIRDYDIKINYDVILATGSLHCLMNENEITKVISKMKTHTLPNGYNLISAFNNGKQDLNGHPTFFKPCLLSHDYYLYRYKDWKIELASNIGQEDCHPDNNIVHFHSITRLLAKNES